MAKTKRPHRELARARPQRAKLSPDESLKRMQDFTKRKEQFVAAVRKGD